MAHQERLLHSTALAKYVRDARTKSVAARFYDGGGLQLQVTPNGSAWWRFRYRFHGVEKMLSLGVYDAVKLDEARDLRDGARKLLRSDVDPSADRKAQKVARGDTFKAFAADFYEQYAAKKKLSATTRARDSRILEHLYKRLGGQPLSGISPPELLSALRYIAKHNGNETAHRALGLASRVFSDALGCGKVQRDPSAGLPLDAAVSTSRAAITKPAELAELLLAIDAYQGEPVTIAGLKLLALLFPRPSELRLASWTEFALEGEEPTWIIPAERMKLRREHIVPLPTQAVAILEELRKVTGKHELVFMSIQRKPLSEAAFSAALATMGYKGKHQPHGFRSTASTLLHEQGHASDVIELSLAHAIPGVRGIYNRAHLLPQRRELLQTWADYLDKLRAESNQQ